MRVLPWVLSVMLFAGCVSGYQRLSFDETPTVEPLATVDWTHHRGPLRLAALGDIGDGPAELAQALAEHHAREPFDGILLLGDNFDPCGVSSVDDPLWSIVTDTIVPLDIPILPVLGNHDYGDPKWRFGRLWNCGEPDPGAQIAASEQWENWIFPARNWELRTPHATLLFLDTTPVSIGARKPVLGSQTGEWIRKTAAERLRQASGWKIVVGHHHLYASGINRWRAIRGIERMEAFHGHLAGAGTDLYVSGHRHHLEVLSDGAPDTPVLLVSGAASRPKEIRRIGSRGPETVFPDAPVPAELGYAVLEITAESIEITVHDVGTKVLGGWTMYRDRTLRAHGEAGEAAADGR